MFQTHSTFKILLGTFCGLRSIRTSGHARKAGQQSSATAQMASCSVEGVSMMVVVIPHCVIKLCMIMLHLLLSCWCHMSSFITLVSWQKLWYSTRMTGMLHMLILSQRVVYKIVISSLLGTKAILVRALMRGAMVCWLSPIHSLVVLFIIV